MCHDSDLPSIDARFGDGLDGRRQSGRNPAEGDVRSADAPANYANCRRRTSRMRHAPPSSQTRHSRTSPAGGDNLRHLGRVITCRYNAPARGGDGTGDDCARAVLAGWPLAPRRPGIRYLAGQRIQFATATQWVARLSEAKRQGSLETELRKLSLVPLIVVDEVGYIPFNPEAANLMFSLVSNRYERASMIVTSNKPLSAWGEIFGTTWPRQR